MAGEDILVLGGGIVGLSIGLALQARGLAVTMVDAAGERAPASAGNAGQIAVEQHEPLASLAMIRALPRRLMSMGGPVSFPPGAVGQWLPFGLRLIRAVSQLGGSLTALKSAMPELVNTPEMRFQVDESRKFAVIDEVLVRLAASGATVDRTDGARVNTPDGWWLLRASNTQDVLVARAEAKSGDALDRLLGQIDEQLALSGLERGPQAGH